MMERGKQMKKLLYIFLLILIPILLTGCKQDDMDGITITTTSYPIEYVTKRLYGRHAKVKSVYPDGVDQNTYQISAKTKKKISETNLFIYNGNLENDKKLALELLDLNPSLKIIDASLVITPTYSSYELWLNPSYLLMMSQNIRTGLKEYITSSLLEKEIDKNHELLKEELSSILEEVSSSPITAYLPYLLLIVLNNLINFFSSFNLILYLGLIKSPVNTTISGLRLLIFLTTLTKSS